MTLPNIGCQFLYLRAWMDTKATQRDIEKWLFDLGQGIKRDWELVIIKNDTTLSEFISDFTKTDYHLEILKEKELLIISRSPFSWVEGTTYL